MKQTEAHSCRNRKLHPTPLSHLRKNGYALKNAPLFVGHESNNYSHPVRPDWTFSRPKRLQCSTASPRLYDLEQTGAVQPCVHHYGVVCFNFQCLQMFCTFYHTFKNSQTCINTTIIFDFGRRQSRIWCDPDDHPSFCSCCRILKPIFPIFTIPGLVSNKLLTTFWRRPIFSRFGTDSSRSYSKLLFGLVRSLSMVFRVPNLLKTIENFRKHWKITK